MPPVPPFGRRPTPAPPPPPAPRRTAGPAPARPRRAAGRPALAFALGALAATGCGGDERHGGGATPEAEFLTSYETLLCGLVGDCCAASGLPFARERCPEAVRATFAAALSDGARYAYDGEAAGRCLDALRALPATCAPFAGAAFGPGSDVARACARAFAPRGSAPPGAPCAGTWQCAPPAGPDELVACEVVDRSDGVRRACVLRAYADEGGPCAAGPAPRPGAQGAIVRTCKPGPLYCAGDGSCRRAAAAGAPCEAGAAGACAGDAFCGEAGACEPRRGPGGACKVSPDACDGATFCDRAAGACLPRRAPGERCGDAGECATSCVGGACAPATADRRDDYAPLCAL